MKKWNLIVDVDSCTNCNVCVLACQDEHVDNEFPGYAAAMPKHGHRWIEIRQKERGQAPMIDVAYLPVMCQHCDAAPCIEAAENGAVTKRPDGIVIIDPEKAKGQKQLVESCPYGAIWWNEERETPQHWIFDAHLLDAGWTEPRAAQVCATAAIKALKVTDDEMREIAASERLETFRPDYGTKPRVWYKNLHRYTKCFVGGSVETEQDGKSECLADVTVRLRKAGQLIASTSTDAFGDFKFDGIEEDSGEYQLELEIESRPTKTIDVALGKSVYVGEIPL